MAQTHDASTISGSNLTISDPKTPSVTVARILALLFPEMRGSKAAAEGWVHLCEARADPFLLHVDL